MEEIHVLLKENERARERPTQPNTHRSRMTKFIYLP